MTDPNQAITALSDRSVLRIAGPDAEKLLQGLLTCDLDALSPDALTFGGLLTPQGKIIAEFLAIRAGDDVLLDTPATTLADLVKRLTLYRLRADVRIEPLLAGHVLWSRTSEPLAAFGAPLSDPRCPSDTGSGVAPLGWRLILSDPEASAPDASSPNMADDLVAGLAASGILECGIDYASASHFAHDVGWDLRGGVDFRKGCYVGQEVVSRMKHKAEARRRPVIVHWEGKAAAPGTPLLHGETELGQIGRCVESGDGGDGRIVAAAIARIDKIARALRDDAGGGATAITVAGTPVMLTAPSWATYALSGAAGSDVGAMAHGG